MTESQLLLSRFLRSGNPIAVGGEIRDNLVVETLEEQAQVTTHTLLDQFLNGLDNNSEIPCADILMPVFLLQNLLQKIHLDDRDPLCVLRDTVSEGINNLDFKNIQQTVQIPTDLELVTAIIQVIRALIEGV